MFGRPKMAQIPKSGKCFQNSVEQATEAALKIKEILYQQNHPDMNCT